MPVVADISYLELYSVQNCSLVLLHQLPFRRPFIALGSMSGWALVFQIFIKNSYVPSDDHKASADVQYVWIECGSILCTCTPVRVSDINSTEMFIILLSCARQPRFEICVDEKTSG